MIAQKRKIEEERLKEEKAAKLKVSRDVTSRYHPMRSSSFHMQPRLIALIPG